jgi:L-lysine 6-transaminase
MSVHAEKVREILGRNILADGFEPIMDLNKSHGSWLVDERNGDKYLDMFSMFASGAVGYNHPKILAVKDKIALAGINKPTLSDVYNPLFADFVQTFDEIAVPDYLKHAFFIDGGALAVENALKIAFDWKVRKNMEAGKGEKGMQVVHFHQAFHGRSGYTTSLTNTTDPRKTMYFPQFKWPRIHNPKMRFPLTDDALKDIISSEEKSIAQFKQAILDNPDDIASIIIEPIQGEGGDNQFRDEYFIQLREICDENDIIFIMDEVQTGVGITGKMWAHEHYTIKPDIISFGKKTQVCGALAGPRIDEVEKNVFNESSRINSTFGGNLVDMVRFQTTLEIIKEENLIKNAETVGNYLIGKLEELSTEFPAYVTNPRGKGLFSAFDLPSQTERDEVWGRLMDEKLLILISGDQSIRFRPHLNVSTEEIDIAMEIIHKAVRNTLK